MKDLQSRIMKHERKVDEHRAKQHAILLEEIRGIQEKYGCQQGTVTLVMDYDPAGGYSCSVDDMTFDGVKLPKKRQECFEEIYEMVSDYSFVFAGVVGVATVTPESTDILFET